MTLERGTLLHKRYRIVEILGQGGMGSVYRAVDENLGMEVAVKDNLFTTEEYARQFRLEAVILASLRHPNLPRVTDHFVIGDQGQYLIMDYIEGEDLRQRMEREGTIPDEDAIVIGVGMCDALHYLHTRKPCIVHRDVKPGNVKISPDGHVHLVDFGLAKVVRGSQATTTGARAMTPGYSPPEQYGTARTDPRSDVYSLGATLYAALCGVIPEDGLARAMDNVELTPLRKHNPKVTRRLAQAIEKAMAVRPDERFQSAEDFRQALLSVNTKQQKEGTILVSPPPPLPEGNRLAYLELVEEEKTEAPSEPSIEHKRGAGFWVFLSLFLLLTLTLLIIFWKPITQIALGLEGTPTAMEQSASLAPATTTIPSATNSSPARPTYTIAPSTTPESHPTNTLIPGTPDVFVGATTATSTPEATQALAKTPQGSSGQVAFASNRTGVNQIFLMDLDGSNLHQITNLPEGACQPTWSPDGTQIVFISPCSDRRELYSKALLYAMSADGSGITLLPGSHAGDFDPSWSPDGTRIVFASHRTGRPLIHILNLNDNTIQQIEMDISIQEAYQPAWSPAGTQIAYTVRRVGVLQVWVMSDLGDGQEQLVRSGSEYNDFKPAWSADGSMIVFTQSSGPLTIGWLMGIPYELRNSQAARRLTNGSYAIDAEYFPNGQWMVFETLTETNYDIAVMGADGTGRVRLTIDPAFDYDPTWRPVLP